MWRRNFPVLVNLPVGGGCVSLGVGFVWVLGEEGGGKGWFGEGGYEKLGFTNQDKFPTTAIDPYRPKQPNSQATAAHNSIVDSVNGRRIYPNSACCRAVRLDS